ncbi:MAG: MmcQ/YjbR family DNA-binding protein [Gemmatimonadota bacterium]
MALPKAREVEAWGAPTFRVKTIFAMYSSPEPEKGQARGAAWIKSDPVNQQLLMNIDPNRFFSPPYVGPKGWIGVVLDEETDWAHLDGLLWDAWRNSVPKKLAAQYPEAE